MKDHLNFLPDNKFNIPPLCADGIAKVLSVIAFRLKFYSESKNIPPQAKRQIKECIKSLLTAKELITSEQKEFTLD